MDDLKTKTVEELQNELRNKNLPITGLKQDLINRLAEYTRNAALLEVEASIPLGQSAASSIATRSSRSSISSHMAKARAKRVALEIEEKAMKAKQDLQMQRLALQIKEDQLDLQTKMEQARMQEQIFAEADETEFANLNEIHIPQEPKLNTPPQNQNLILELLANNQKLLQLPNLEPLTFNGDYLDYPAFIQSFETSIASKTSNNKDKLHFLYKYTTGVPHDLIKGFLIRPNENSYAKAIELLNQRYGHPYRISEAYRRALEKWTNVYSGEQLLKLADFMRQCEVGMETMEYLDDLNSMSLLRMVVGKLPNYARVKWCKNAYKLRNNYGREVNFHDLTKFVAEEAEISNDPLFAPTLFKNENLKTELRPKRSDRNLVSFHTEVKVRSSSPICIYCRKDQRSNEECQHDIADCELFGKKKWSDRVEFMKKESACFGCGSIGKHRVADCKRKKQCKICKRQHLTSMHKYSNSYTERASVNCTEVREEATNETEEASVMCTGVCSQFSNGEIDNSLIVPMWVRNTSAPGKEVMVYGVIDPQSNQCFVDENLCKVFGVQGPTTKLRLSTMQEEDFEIDSQKVKGFEILDRHRQHIISVHSVFTRKSIPAKSSQIPKPETAKQWKHLQSLESKIMPYDPKIKVALLIGSNIPRLTRPRNLLVGGEDQPYGQRCLFGWGIIGNVCKYDKNRQSNADTSCFRTSLEELNKENYLRKVIKVMETDFSEHNTSYFGKPYSVEDERFMKIMETGCRKELDGHYSMPLPIRSTKYLPKNNKSMAIKRFKQLQGRFRKNVKFKEDYVDFIDEVLQNYAEKVPEKEIEDKTLQVNYIPHSGVYHPKKVDKIRIVFDCSAKFAGKSLNDALLQGPDLLNSLIGVLLRFRQERIAFSADIKGMFHQFYVHKEHRNLLRFLWSPKEFSDEIYEYRMKVHLFGATSSPGCANFGLRKAADDGEEQYGKAAADFVRRNFYVDDGLKSVSTVSEAILLIRNSQNLCQNAGLKLHKFLCNNEHVLEAIPEKDRSNKIENELHNLRQLAAVLGMHWCTISDCFKLDINLKEKPTTRRGILSYISSIYDPLGFVAPVTLKGKIILQELCRQKIDWDEPIPLDLETQWKKFQDCADGRIAYEHLEIEPTQEDDTELKRTTVIFSTNSQESSLGIERFDRYSSWNKVKRALANCLKFTHRIKSGNLPRNTKAIDYSKFISPLVEDYQKAECILIRAIQHKSFFKEIEILQNNGTGGATQFERSKVKNNKRQISRCSGLFRLDPFLDGKGIIRVGGRLRRSMYENVMKHPVVLPRNEHLTILLVRHFHESVNHMGKMTTLNEIRQNGYWIINGPSVVGKFIVECVTCKKLRGKFLEQKMADLPPERIEESSPFLHTGVDYFGPFMIKEGRKMLKRYGVIFTCLSSRAVHLETANSLSTDSFLNALRRFVNRRGPVRSMRSDQGTNFVGARNELQQALTEMDNKIIKNELVKVNCDFIEFKMNVPHSSHMGGVWERLIRTTRSALSSLLIDNSTCLNDEALRTLLTEVENTVNSRPLTIDNLNDPLSLEPITPSQLLTLKNKTVYPLPGNFIPTDLCAKKTWRRVQYLAQLFWTRWRREYLHLLQTRQKWVTPRRNLQESDVVLIEDKNAPRNEWKLGKVIGVCERFNELINLFNLRLKLFCIEAYHEDCFTLGYMTKNTSLQTKCHKKKR
ncbi:hypothetical protein GQR58_026910 [Nymphon striatum]|nr:hypothetical protein GQR58_026910 [Nymphon striatum]